MTKHLWIVGLGATVLLSGCASMQQGPIDGIGPSGYASDLVKDVQPKSLRSESIIDNKSDYSRIEIAQMESELANMPCKTVHFAFDKYQLKAKYHSCLDQAAEYLQKHGQVIRLAGHTDPRGSEKYNFNLGQKRAQAVEKYLESKGVPSDQICTVSFGKLRPAADPKDFYQQYCPSDTIDASCKQKARDHAYYLDRRTVLEFGQRCEAD